MYHVQDDDGREVGKSEKLSIASRYADEAKKRKLNGSANFHVEERIRVYTTTTLEEAIKDTPFDPAYVAPVTHHQV